MIRDTDLPGSPGDLERVAYWLSGSFAAAAGAFADEVYDGRNRTLAAWESDAATSFRAELRTLGTATEGVQGAATSLGSVLSGLAVVLRRAQEDMASAREVARSGGLTVAGTVIFAPGPAPATPATLPVDATPAEAAAHDRAVAAGLEHSRRVEAWNAAVLIADAADRSWAEALSDAQATWADRGDEITSLLQDLFSGAAQEYLKIRVSRYFSDGATVWRQQAGIWREIADSYLRDGRFVGINPDDYYRALQRIDEMDALARNSELSGTRVATNVGRAFLALGVLATGYGIYDDMTSEGESAAQATTSNVGGFLAGLGAGAASGAGIGALAGSFIPVPGVGTAVGAVVGTVVGAGVGIVTSGAIDSMWENGVDSLGDVGSAIGDGWDELEETGGALVDLGGDAVDAVGDGLSGAWDSVFG